MGKFIPSLLRGRTSIPVAPGTFSQEEGEGVWMEVPGQPGRAVLECEDVPLGTRQGMTPLQPKGASPAPACSIPHSQGTQGIPGTQCPPHCAQPLATHT